ncbi:substrate-binding periplasmic protein [Colwelliaceae bacterium 6471]
MVKFVLAICMLILTFQSYGRELIIGVNERDIYRYIDKNGSWAGKDIELIKAVFRRTPYTFKIISMPWPRVLKGLESGDVDMTLAGSILPERQAYALFSKHVFRYSHYMLFVHKSKLDLFQSVTVLADLTKKDILIGALRGAIYSDSYNELLKNDEFVERLAYIGDDQHMASFVLKRRVDAYIDSEIEGKHYLLKEPDYSNNIIPLFRITSDEEAESNLMYSKKTISQTLVDEFDEALRELHQSGEYEQISKKFDPAEQGS